jgi:hypothetical protein
MLAWFMQIVGAIPSNLWPFIDAGGLAASAGTIAKGFEWFDGALSSKGRTAISQWLVNQSPEAAADNWSSAFSDIVDRVFSKTPLSLKFFPRSCLASLIAFVIVVTIYARIHPESFDDLGHVGLALGLFAAANLIPDYFSLLISRGIVRRMAQRPNSTRVFALLLLDTILKAMLATCVIYIGSLIVSIIFPDGRLWAAAWGSVRSFYATFPPFRSGGGLPIFGLLFYSSFFTSMWVWFYVLGGLLIKALTRTGRLWRLVAPFLDLQVNPLKAIGRVVGATYFVAGLLFVALIHIVR